MDESEPPTGTRSNRLEVKYLTNPRITHSQLLTNQSEIEKNDSELLETIEELRRNTSEIANKVSQPCLLFYECDRSLDVDCIANGNKPYGCTILKEHTEKNLTAPPARYNLKGPPTIPINKK